MAPGRDQMHGRVLVVRSGGTPTRPLPLDDVRILAVEQYGAGPFGSMLLADLGATVIKIEDPRSGGDVGRYVPPFQVGEDSLFFEALNRNKRSVSLDLGTAAGREAFRRLAANVDAVFSNLRGDVPDRLGLTYEHLAAVNPSIVCCSLSAFGTAGRHRSEPGYDYLLQGLAGWMAVTGEPDGPPTKSGLSLVDFSASHAAALAVMVGVHAARRDGIGLDCDIALFDVAIGMLNYLGTWHLTGGHEPERLANSAHPSLTPFQNFEAADGWIVIACAKEKFWDRLPAALGLPALASDARFATMADRAQHAEVLTRILSEEIRSQTVTTLLERLQQAGVPCAPVLTVPEALAREEVLEREMMVSYRHPVHGEVRAIGSPIKVGTERARPRPAPERGEGTAAVLRSLGALSDSEIADLGRRGAFGPVSDGVPGATEGAGPDTPAPVDGDGDGS